MVVQTKETFRIGVTHLTTLGKGAQHPLYAAYSQMGVGEC